MSTTLTLRTQPTTTWSGRPSIVTNVVYDSLNLYNVEIAYDGVIGGTVWTTRIIP